MSENREKQKKRLIFHVDMDAFFAACEELSRPELKSLPMVVGGRSQRGIVTTANYTARKFGIHSAMPIFLAKQACPDLIILPGHMDLYAQKSREVFAILRTYTRYLEPASIDEAYLDMTRRPEDPLFLAHAIQDEVWEKTGLSLSVGIASNKFYAKLASDWKKPHGIFWLRDEEADELLDQLPIAKIHGVGQASQDRLRSMAIYTVGDLKQLDAETLIALFGKSGRVLYGFIRGQDQRPVQSESRRKSIGIERTLAKDVADSASIYAYIETLAQDLSLEMQSRSLLGRTIQLKLKSADYKSHTRSRSLAEGINDAERLAETGKALYASMPQDQPFRLIGLSASSLSDADVQQLDFFD